MYHFSPRCNHTQRVFLGEFKYTRYFRMLPERGQSGRTEKTPEPTRKVQGTGGKRPPKALEREVFASRILETILI